VFAGFNCLAFALSQYVGLHSAQAWIVIRKRLSFGGVLDAPIDHVAKERHAL
jgi:hypothetical protein